MLAVGLETVGLENVFQWRKKDPRQQQEDANEARSWQPAAAARPAPPLVATAVPKFAPKAQAAAVQLVMVVAHKMRCLE